MKPDLQTRIVEVLRTHGAQPARDMPRWLTDVDSIALDCGLSALIRTNKVVLSASTYSLPGQSPAVKTKEPAASVPPSVAANGALPAPATLVCLDCRIPKLEGEFQPLRDSKRSKVCISCHGKRTRAGMVAAEQRRAARVVSVVEGEPILFHSAQRDNGTEALKVGHQTVNLAGTPPIAGSSPAGSTNSDTPRERGDNRDVSTERGHKAAAVPETSGSYSRSDPREDARTPASTDIASPRIAEHVFDRVKRQRQDKLNRIALLEVELANARSYVAERERFLADYERFGGAAT